MQPGNISSDEAMKIEQLERILLCSLKSGDSIKVTPSMIEAVRKRLRVRSAGRQRSR
jgi:hypothetical protein